jgi:hypothetical protein
VVYVVTTSQIVKISAHTRAQTDKKALNAPEISDNVLVNPVSETPADEFKVNPQPINRLAEAGKTVSWTAPVGGIAGYLAQMKFHLWPNSDLYTQSLDFLNNRLPKQIPTSEIYAKGALDLNKLKSLLGWSVEQIQHAQDYVTHTPIADLMQHPEKILQAAHISDHTLAAGVGGALFTGAIGLGMSQLFANDKKTAYQKIADIETQMAKEKARKDADKQLGELKKQQELKEKQAEIAELEAELSPEAGQ